MYVFVILHAFFCLLFSFFENTFNFFVFLGNFGFSFLLATYSKKNVTSYYSLAPELCFQNQTLLRECLLSFQHGYCYPLLLSEYSWSDTLFYFLGFTCVYIFVFFTLRSYLHHRHTQEKPPQEFYQALREVHIPKGTEEYFFPVLQISHLKKE